MKRSRSVGETHMIIKVLHQEQQYVVSCGDGQQKIRWLARVVAQRFSTDGIWCAPKETAIPTVFAPGRVTSPSDDDPRRWEELDYDAVIDAVLNDGGTVKVDLLLTPAPPLKQEKIDDGLESKVVKPQDFAKVGLVTVLSTSSGVSAFRSDVGDPPSYEDHLDPDGRLIATSHGRFRFKEEFDCMKLEAVLEHSDAFMLRDFKHLMRRLWKDLIEIYIHYSETPFDADAYLKAKRGGFKPKKKGEEKEEELPEEPPVMNLRTFALFCRTCRLTSTSFTFHKLLVTSFPRIFASIQEEPDDQHWNICMSPGNFMEALVRIAAIKCANLHGIAERVNTLIHSAVFPYATADDRDSDDARIRQTLSAPAVMCVFSTGNTGTGSGGGVGHCKTFWKLYKQHFKQHAPPTQPRTLTIRRMYLLMKQNNLFDDTFQPADFLRCFTSAMLCAPSSSQAISLDDDSIELSFFEVVEVGIYLRCYLLCRRATVLDNLWTSQASFLHPYLDHSVCREFIAAVSFCLPTWEKMPRLKQNVTAWLPKLKIWRSKMDPRPSFVFAQGPLAYIWVRKIE
jgi:hypothetical protein